MVDVFDDVWGLFSSGGESEDSSAAPEAEAEAVDSACPYCGCQASACDGYYTCGACGALVERVIDSSAEWRYFGAAAENAGGGWGRKDPSRCGMPFNDLMPNSSYNLTLAGSGRDCRITKKYHMWNSSNYRDRTLWNTFEAMSLQAQHSGLSTAVVEEAKVIYKRIRDTKIIIRGSNRVGIIAACIYMACKMHRVPRSTREVARVFDIDHSVMTRGCKILAPFIDCHLESCEPLDFVARFASRLSMSCADQTRCKRLVATIEALAVATENTPPAVAAAGILLAQQWWPVGDDIDKHAIAAVSGISAVTIAKCCHKLGAHRDLVLKHIEQL